MEGIALPRGLKMPRRLELLALARLCLAVVLCGGLLASLSAEEDDAERPPPPASRDFHPDATDAVRAMARTPNDLGPLKALLAAQPAALLGLVNYYGDLEVQGGQASWSPHQWHVSTLLNTAILFNASSVWQYLLDHGANPNLSSSGERALDLAVELNYLPLAALLIERGAVVQSEVIDEHCNLATAVRQNEFPMVKLLVEHGANVTYMDQHGFQPIWYTPPQIREGNGSFALPAYLLAHGTPVDIESREHFTMLHCAIENNEPVMAQFLLAHGADPCRAFWSLHDGPSSLWRHWPENDWMGEVGLRRSDFWAYHTRTVCSIMYPYYRPMPVWGDLLVLLAVLIPMGWRTWRWTVRNTPDAAATAQAVMALKEKLQAGATWDAEAELPPDEILEKYVRDSAAYLRWRAWVAMPIYGLLVFALLFLYDPAASQVISVPIWSGLVALYLFGLTLHLFKHAGARMVVGLIGVFGSAGLAIGLLILGNALSSNLACDWLQVTYLFMAGLMAAQALIHIRLQILNARILQFDQIAKRLFSARDRTDIAPDAGWDQQQR